MARKIAQYKIEKEGRDLGKVFRLTEMGVFQAESWAMRAILAIGAGNVEVPDDLASLGMAGLAQMGFRALFNAEFSKVEPLLTEMMACVEIHPDPRKPHVCRAIVEGDIEEVSTLLLLRKEVLNLHIDFLADAAISSSVAGKVAGKK